MHPHLVRAPGEDFDFEQRKPLEPAQDSIAAERGPHAWARAAARGHAGTAQAVPADRCGDFASLGCYGSVDQREVVLLDGPPGELGRECLVSQIILGDEQDPGRVAVEAMDDSRPRFPAHPRERLQMVQQGVDQRSAADSCAQVDHHPRRLVDGNHVVILIQDFERDRLRIRSQRRWRLRLNPNALPAAQPVAGLDRLGSRQAFDSGLALSNQLLNARASQRGKPRRQEPVQALAAIGITGGKALAHGGRERHDNPQITQIAKMTTLPSNSASSLNSAERFLILAPDFWLLLPSRFCFPILTPDSRNDILMSFRLTSGLWFVFPLLGFAGTLLSERRKEAWLGGALLAYLWLGTIFLQPANARYRIPSLPWEVLFTVAGLWFAVQAAVWLLRRSLSAVARGGERAIAHPPRAKRLSDTSIVWLATFGILVLLGGRAWALHDARPILQTPDLAAQRIGGQAENPPLLIRDLRVAGRTLTVFYWEDTAADRAELASAEAAIRDGGAYAVRVFYSCETAACAGAVIELSALDEHGRALSQTAAPLAQERMDNDLFWDQVKLRLAAPSGTRRLRLELRLQGGMGNLVIPSLSLRPFPTFP